MSEIDVEGAVEYRAKAYRKGGRWIIFLAMPEWVESEVVQDLKRDDRGVILNTERTTLLLGSRPVGAAANAAPVRTDTLQENRIIENLPQGLRQSGKPLVVKERPPHDRPPQNLSVEVRLRDYIRSCDEAKCAADIDWICREFTLVPTTARRRVQQELARAVEKGYITPESALIIHPPLERARAVAKPGAPSGMRRGITPGYRYSDEAKAQMQAKRKETRARKAQEQASA